jgi:cytoskeletal protein CcmA (bactofilin family)
MSLFNRNDKSGDTTGHQPQTSKPSQPQTQSLSPQFPARPPQTPPPPAEGAVFKPAEPPRPVSIVQPSPTPAKTGATMASVISKALKITGQLESTEDIQIDGEIEGDVRGVGVKIGQNARVKGTVYGDEVELAGTIEGRIESKKVILTGTARMTGDILHQDIKIESGAFISGSLKPEIGKSDAKPALKQVAATTSPAGVSPAGASVAGAVHH